MDTAAGRVGNIAGNVGMALLPGAALKGAGAVASGYNATRAAAPILTATGNALLAPKSIAGAGALGVGMGAIQPSASTGETIGNMAIGGVASAALPLLVRGYQVAKSAAEPFYDAGRRRIEGGLLRDMAGGEAEKALRNLREASQPFVGAQMDGEPVRRAIGEIVPGSLPTMAQVADVPSLAALERTLAQTNPTIQNAYFQRMKDQGAG
jgi:hypothetical protein